MNTRYASTILFVLIASHPQLVVAKTRLPHGQILHRVSFERHVVPLLRREGCSAGSCHGSFQGKGGFSLSLFGHSPAADHVALQRDSYGRRINRFQPKRSLLLQKAVMSLPHGGGKRFRVGTWQYHLLLSWIRQGATRDAGRGEIRQMTIYPLHPVIQLRRKSLRIQVIAEYRDGTRQDVTAFCEFQVKNKAVAQVDHSGHVKPVNVGMTSLIVTYGSYLSSTQLLVPRSRRPHPRQSEVASPNIIDQIVTERLRRMNIASSQISKDLEFLRRVTIDTIGSLPSPAAARAFLADRRKNKRARMIDRLLAHPAHASLWATKLCDLTGNNLEQMEEPKSLRPKRAKMWHDWFRRRIAQNMPYHQIVRGVLCATSREGKTLDAWMEQEVALLQQARHRFQSNYAQRKSLDLFWRRRIGVDRQFFPLEQMAERTAAAFLGLRIGCARCHKHPFDRWTQADYRGYANIFSQVRFGTTPETKRAISRQLQQRRISTGRARDPLPRVQEIFLGPPSRLLLDEKAMRPLPPKTLAGPTLSHFADYRQGLFEWLVKPQNPHFSQNIVNRVWAHYFGRGLVEPLDGFSLGNPPTHPRLLRHLAQDFIKHGYDLRRLERRILLSRTYQRSSIPTESNRIANPYYSRSTARLLMAEVVLDLLNAATGATTNFGVDCPPRLRRAIEVAPNRIAGEGQTIFSVFGRPRREQTCDCERPKDAALRPVFFLMSDKVLEQKINGGRLSGLLATHRSDGDLMDELYLATLTRLPRATERRHVTTLIQKSSSRQETFRDLLWALINTAEFITNH